MRQIEVVAAIDRANRDQPHRRIVLLHVPDLHRRRVRAQQRQRLRRMARGSVAEGRGFSPGVRRRLHRLREIQRVLHVARRMLGGHVERFEVVVVVLDLGAFEHLIAETREDLLHLFAHEAERMPEPSTMRAGQRDVDRAGRAAGRGQRRFALGDCGFDRSLQLVGLPADLALLVGRRLSRRVHEGR